MTHRLSEICLARRLAATSNALPTHFVRDKCLHFDRRSGKGGDLTVPAEAEDAFLDAFVHDVASGSRVCLCEQPGDAFRQFFCVTLPDEENVQILARVATQTLRRFYAPDELELDDGERPDTDPFECAVTAVQLHSGEHLVYVFHPALTVDARRALLHRAAFVCEMGELPVETQTDVLGPGGDAAAWEKAVHSAVYFSGSEPGRGVPMPGAYPKTVCRGGAAPCTRQTMDRCTSCVGTGFVTLGEQVRAVAAFTGDCRPRDFERKVSRQLVDALCIRTTGPLTAGWRAFEGAPQVPLVTDALRGLQLAPKFATDRSVGKNVIESLYMKQMAQLCARRCGAQYARTRVQVLVSAGRPSAQPVYFVKVSGEGSSYCANIAADHPNSRIYFKISELGVQQCCWVCDKYRRRPVEISHDAKRALRFPVHVVSNSSTLSQLENDYIPLLDAIRWGRNSRRKAIQKTRR